MYDRFIDYDDSHLHFQATLMPFQWCSFLIRFNDATSLNMLTEPSSPEECFRLGKIIIGGYGVMTKLHNLKANEAGHILVSCHSNSQHRSHRVGGCLFHHLSSPSSRYICMIHLDDPFIIYGDSLFVHLDNPSFSRFGEKMRFSGFVGKMKFLFLFYEKMIFSVLPENTIFWF